MKRYRTTEQELEEQKRATSEAVEAFLVDAQDVADSGGVFGLFSGVGRSVLPSPRSPGPSAVPPTPPPQMGQQQQQQQQQQQLGGAAWPAQAPERPPPPRGEQCLDAFGAGSSESRYWTPSGPTHPKRPPGASGNGPNSQLELWPYGSQQSAGSMGPAPRPLQKLKASGATPLRAICGGPLGLYVLSSLSFALLLQVWPVPSILTVLGLALALHLSLPQSVSTKGRLGDGDLLPFGVCACAAVFGVLTGIYAHEAFASPFYVVALGREYRNVLASSSSAAYEDAGKLHFANTSNLDYTRVLGYQNQHRYCVAPVVDSGSAQTTRVGFWAVGMDCCDFRGGFACGDAGANADSVKSGSRAPRDGIFESRRTNYIHAIKQAAAVYNLEVDSDPVLVNWAANPSGAQSSSLVCAFFVVFLGAAFFVLLGVATLMCTVAT